MAGLKFILLALVVVSVWAEDEELSVSELLWKANKDVVHTEDEPYIVDDIAYASENERNADPCTSRNCMWGKSNDGKVYVPYIISNEYSPRELSVIERGLESFSSFSCIRFVRYSDQRDYLNIRPLNGCYSSIGRFRFDQTVSLSRYGCIYHTTVQHELLHALGFHHEQNRSDRDNHIRIQLQNVQPGKESNFWKVNTLNQGTPYDYNSIMQYGRYNFSKNNKPTLVPIPDENVKIGQASEISQNDIIRLNTLYKC